MEKEIKTNKQRGFLKRINQKIANISNAGLALMITGYIVLLVAITILVLPKNKDYNVIPGYTHQTEFSEISPRIQIISKRTLSGDDIKETYSVRASTSARKSSEEKAEIGLDILRFQMQALTSNNDIYYFTENSGKKTNWAYSTTLTNEYEPSILFTSIKYIDQNGDTQVKSFKEDVMLELENKELYNSGNVIQISDDVKFTLQTIAIDSDNDKLVSVRIVPTTSSYFHIDMQSWIETETGETMPFIGVYNYSKDTWAVSSERVIKRLEAKTLYFKVVCYYNGDVYQALYKADIASLPQNYTDLPNEVSVDLEENKAMWPVYTGVAATVCILAAITIVIATKSKKRKNQEEK